MEGGHERDGLADEGTAAGIEVVPLTAEAADAVAGVE